MANKKMISMRLGIPGVELIIWYNDANMRIGNIEWNIQPPGIAARLKIWDSNVSAETPVIDRTEGQGSGAENIPGNYKLVERVDPEFGPELAFPDNITFSFQIRTV